MVVDKTHESGKVYLQLTGVEGRLAVTALLRDALPWRCGWTGGEGGSAF